MSPLGSVGTPQPASHGPIVNAGGGGGIARNPKHTKVTKKGSKKVRKKGQGSTDWFQNPLTNKQAKQETHDASFIKYHNQFRDIQNELGVSKTQQKRTEQWYDDYKREVNRASQRSQKIYGQAENAVRGFSDASAAQSNQMQAGLNEAAQRDAALRGVSVDPSVAQVGVAAQGARRNIQGAALGNLATHGAANTAYLSNQARNVAAEKLLAHQEEAGRARKIRLARRDLHAEQGAFRNTERDRLRGTERNWWLAKKTLSVNERKAAIAAALANQSAQETKRHHKALESSSKHDDMLADKRYRLDVKKFGAAEAKTRWQQRHGSTSSKGPSGGDKSAGRKVVSDVSKMISRAKSIYAHTHSAHQIYAYGRQQGWDNDLINAAADIALLGHLSSTNRKRLKERLKGTGISIPSGW